ncbi:hypothetical protein ACIQNG_21445 [Streptomyces sp. NPDC091377]|uniref:hypothetical protein n=1 Tax=Streptomyces sp. NPDC091377 TaxID=3365995 RepID=UPI00380142A3
MNTYSLVHRDPAPDLYGRLRVQRHDLDPARRFFQRVGGRGDFGTVTGVAAPGFPAYARILHPASLAGTPVRWADVAAAYGRTVTSATRWHALIGMDRDYTNATAYGRAGVWDEHPCEGPTPADLARALLPYLARHTTTPDHCWFGLWHGYGRLDFDHVPTFPTPERDEVLLAGALADAPSPELMEDFAELPDLWWPQDAAWCLGGDVGLVSTYVGGTPELIADLLAAPDLEAHPVAPGATVD